MTPYPTLQEVHNELIYTACSTSNDVFSRLRHDYTAGNSHARIRRT
jgi:hypothetical protein